MLMLPNPKRLLLGYLAGAFTTSITIGIAIEIWLSDSSALSTTKHTINPALNIALGSLLLVLAFVLGTGKLTERRERKHAGKPKKTPKWQTTLSKGSARSTFIVGLLLTFPGGSYLAALTEISKQNFGNAEVVLVVIAVNVVMLMLLELPLIGYVGRSDVDAPGGGAAQGLDRPQRRPHRRDRGGSARRGADHSRGGRTRRVNGTRPGWTTLRPVLRRYCVE